MVFRIEPAAFNEVFSLADPIERVFPNVFSHYSFSDGKAGTPSINVAEYKDELQVVAELPGVSKEDVKLQIHDGELTISGERKAPETSDETEWLRREIAYGSFTRTIQLPESVDAEKVVAEFANGILRITLPKQEAAKAKEIVIR